MNVSGSIELRKGKRGSVWHAKHRLANGSQRMKKIGPAWTQSGGRPPEGYFTRKTAKSALDAILTDARRGTGEPSSTGAIFEMPADLISFRNKKRQGRELSTAERAERVRQLHRARAKAA